MSAALFQKQNNQIRMPGAMIKPKTRAGSPISFKLRVNILANLYQVLSAQSTELQQGLSLPEREKRESMR